MIRALTPLLILPLLLAGCAKGTDEQANGSMASKIESAPIESPLIDNGADNAGTTPMNAQVARAALPTDDWIGSWAGPEGLYLDILASSSGEPGNYLLVSKDNLDRQGHYSGMADGAAIRFQRDGQDLTIRAGTGKDTGFKYLADKQDCLIVIPGKEGYCR